MGKGFDAACGIEKSPGCMQNVLRASSAYLAVVRQALLSLLALIEVLCVCVVIVPPISFLLGLDQSFIDDWEPSSEVRVELIFRAVALDRNVPVVELGEGDAIVATELGWISWKCPNLCLVRHCDEVGGEGRC